VLFCCYLHYSVYCLCVNVYCTTATGCQPNCSYQIYHIMNTSTVIQSNYLLWIPWFSDTPWSKQPYFLPASDPYRWCPTRHALLPLLSCFLLEALHEQSRKTWKHKHKKYSTIWPSHICNCHCSFCLEEIRKTIHFFIKKSIVREMLQQGLYFKCSCEEFVTITCCDLRGIKDCVLRSLKVGTHL